MLKVVHVITGLEDGGAESVLYRLCTSDVGGMHVVISLTEQGKYGEMLNRAKVQVHSVGMRRGQFSLRRFAELRVLLRELKPDVVQTWMYHADFLGGLAARSVGLTRICWGIRHTTFDSSQSKRSTIWIARLNAWLSHIIPQRIICCGYEAMRVHAKLGYHSEKLLVITNGYDLNAFRPDTSARIKLRHELVLDPTMAVIGMVGRFDPQKNHKNLLKALLKVKSSFRRPFRCLLIGNDMDEANAVLTEWISGLGLQDEVILLGSRPDIASIMNVLDIHVLSSAFGEGFPNVLAEAMACGTPCVATDVGDSEMIVGDTGWIVPKDSPECLGEAICSALEEWQDPHLWATRRAKARERIAQNYSLQAMVLNFREAWTRPSVEET